MPELILVRLDPFSRPTDVRLRSESRTYLFQRVSTSSLKIRISARPSHPSRKRTSGVLPATRLDPSSPLSHRLVHFLLPRIPLSTTHDQRRIFHRLSISFHLSSSSNARQPRSRISQRTRSSLLLWSSRSRSLSPLDVQHSRSHRNGSSTLPSSSNEQQHHRNVSGHGSQPGSIHVGLIALSRTLHPQRTRILPFRQPSGEDHLLGSRNHRRKLQPGVLPLSNHDNLDGLVVRTRNSRNRGIGLANSFSAGVSRLSHQRRD